MKNLRFLKRVIICWITAVSLFSFVYAHPLQSLTLKQALQIALRKNPEILIEEGKLKKASGEFVKTKSRSMPLLALHGFAFTGNTVTMIDTPVISPAGWITTTKNGNFGGDVVLSYPLYTGGYLKEIVNSSRFRQFSQREKLKAARLDVIFKTTQAYDSVLLEKGKLQTARSDLKRARESYRLSRQFFKAGKIPYFYLLRSRARLAKSQAKEIEIFNDLKLTEIQLSNVLGETSVLRAVPSGKLSSQQVISSNSLTLKDLLRFADQNRPDSLALLNRIKQIHSEFKSIKGSYYPQVYFYSRYDSLSNSPGAFNGYNVGIHASISLFDGGERAGEIKKAEGNLEVEKGELKRLKLHIKEEVGEGYWDYKTALKELSAARAEVKFAKENLRIVLLRFRSGKGIFLEVLDAEDALTKAQYQEIQALYDLNVSRAYLEWAEGEGEVL